jgi:heptosyltransferase-2/heptosyltransferase-3
VKQLLRLWLLRAVGLLLGCRGSSVTSAPDRPLEILLIRPDHLGDVLLSRPALEVLARSVPRARLTIAVGPWGRPALGPVGDGGRIALCPFPGFSRSPIGPLQPYILLIRYALLWRRRHSYGMAVIMRPDHWWGALLAALMGIPVRIGYDTPETRPFLSVALPRTPGRHAAAEAIALAEAAIQAAGGRMEPDARYERLPRCATPRDQQTMSDALRTVGIADFEPLLVLHPGSGSPLKSWPLEHLASAGDELAATLGARVAVTGAAHERPQAERLAGLLSRGVSLAGRLGWGELEALLARATLVVGVDSGPLHLAVAAGTPSVALFGPADPAQFGPWGSRSRHRVVTGDLPCRPCRRLDLCALEPGCNGPPPCMRGIGVAAVLAAARDALEEGRDDPGPVYQA